MTSVLRQIEDQTHGLRMFNTLPRQMRPANILCTGNVHLPSSNRRQIGDFIVATNENMVKRVKHTTG